MIFFEFGSFRSHHAMLFLSIILDILLDIIFDISTRSRHTRIPLLYIALLFRRGLLAVDTHLWFPIRLPQCSPFITHALRLFISCGLEYRCFVKTDQIAELGALNDSRRRNKPRRSTKQHTEDVGWPVDGSLNAGTQSREPRLSGSSLRNRGSQRP